DILEAIERINKYAVQGRKNFEENELIQSWFMQNLQIIGEASRALSADIREQNPQVPWSQIIGMRNVLTHNYFEIDLDVVWLVIERELPNLKPQIKSILQALS
ncbi:MAG: DUF86 domain-containing protein, partial [Rivularia sp. (in: cyanobacteria)]